MLIVIGSYVAAQYLRVWRPRRRGLQVARVAEQPPSAGTSSASTSVGRVREGRPVRPQAHGA